MQGLSRGRPRGPGRRRQPDRALTSSSRAAGPPAPGGRPPVVRARELGFSYPGDRTALAGVDLELEPGRVVAVMGPNGSGKSTLVRCLATALTPGEGRLDWWPEGGVLRVSAGADAPDRLRRRLAAVFDRTPFADSLSGRENVVHALRLRGIPAPEAQRRAADWMARFSLAGDAGAAAGAYSHGMRRKLALAEAFAAEPDILLLDEPLTGLDPRARRALGAAAREVAAAGTAILLAEHHAGFVRRHAHRVALLHRGRVVAEDTPEALVARLDRGTVFVVEVAGAGAPGADDPPGAGVELPDGVRWLGAHGDVVRLESAAGTRPLPEACAALQRAGWTVRSLRVREPDLEDVFLALTGVPLAPGVSA